ncbi:MAG: hypothetical protein M3N46_11315, partial [Actinomycetota bacterium]|nr:hypothetical protein [Actinomycetota bacterium]
VALTARETGTRLRSLRVGQDETRGLLATIDVDGDPRAMRAALGEYTFATELTGVGPREE